MSRTDLIRICSLFLLTMFLFSRGVQAVIPESYQFADSTTDSKFYRYNPSSQDYSVFPVVGHEFLELTAVGYQIDRSNRQLIISLTTLGTPIVNTSFYYHLNLELESDTSYFKIRLWYSNIGDDTNNSTSTNIVADGDSGPTNIRDDTVTRISGNKLFWVISTVEVDVIRVFDDPNMLFSLVHGELELSANGSSAFRGGNYYRDVLTQDQFDFAGGVQAPRTEEDLLDIVDPVALSFYFGIPLIIFVVRRVQSYLSPV